jgi:hypothetical protein
MGAGRGNGFVQTPVQEGKVVKYFIWPVPTPKILPLDTNKIKDRKKIFTSTCHGCYITIMMVRTQHRSETDKKKLKNGARNLPPRSP